MQQMAGNMSLINPFVFNQFGPYGAYAQVSCQASAEAIAQELGHPIIQMRALIGLKIL